MPTPFQLPTEPSPPDTASMSAEFGLAWSDYREWSGLDDAPLRDAARGVSAEATQLNREVGEGKAAGH